MLRRGEIIEQSSYDQVMEARDSPLFTLINGLGKQNGGSTPGTPGEISDDARTAVDDDHEIDLVKLDEKTDAVVRRRYSQSSLQNAPILCVVCCRPLENDLANPHFPLPQLDPRK